MALTPPTTNDYILFTEDEVAPSYADQALQQSTDLLRIATGLEDPPTDAFDLRVMNTGILAMAEAIVTGKATRTPAPFVREEIGSYSYVRASQSVTGGVPTGVPWFDIAVGHLSSLTEADSLAGQWHDSVGLFEVEDGVNFRTQSGRSIVLGPGDTPLYVDGYEWFRIYGQNPD